MAMQFISVTVHSPPPEDSDPDGAVDQPSTGTERVNGHSGSDKAEAPVISTVKEEPASDSEELFEQLATAAQALGIPGIEETQGPQTPVTAQKSPQHPISATRASKRARLADLVSKRTDKPAEPSKTRKLKELEFSHRDYCSMCGQQQGELEYCDACPRSFHTACLLRAKLQRPASAPQWRCHICDHFTQVERHFRAQPVPDDPETQCRLLLEHLIQNDLSTEFLVPIPESNEAYHDVIESPMDLTTIRIRLTRGHYKRALYPGLRTPYGGLLRFFSDVLNIWSNAMGYNQPNSAVYRQSEMLAIITQKYVDEKLTAHWQSQGYPDFEQHYRKLAQEWKSKQEAICTPVRGSASTTTSATKPRSKESPSDPHKRKFEDAVDDTYPSKALENEASLPVGLACTIPLGTTYVKNFLGKFYWGKVTQYREPFFLCEYDDGDQEELGREDIDKYLSDTYKLVIAGAVMEPSGGWLRRAH